MIDKTKPRRVLRFNGRPVFAFDAGSPRRSADPVVRRGPLFREEDAQITVGAAALGIEAGGSDG